MTQIFIVKVETEKDHRTAESPACEQGLDVSSQTWEFDPSAGLALSTTVTLYGFIFPSIIY